ncbi:hypothetical protein WJU16_19860 [Chitinophaga pollutisoli]|uniref:Membrane or secreted protein n=1 Tax=Chitinophaga pollutisoli TaxID=3133966 RepID=A0ABZ2YLK0_9BACT
MKAFLFACLLLMGGASYAQSEANGSWILQRASQDTVTILLIQDDYFSYTDYTPTAFMQTFGGTIQTSGQNMDVVFEFSSHDKDMIGNTRNVPYRITGGMLTLTLPEGELVFSRASEAAPNDLAGTWRITGRMVDDKMSEMKPGPRKTLKVLTGGRFQWIAMNTETKEFFGTGGGTYTFENGKYTETITFFSRDNNRVGRNVQFDAKVEDGKWHHSGKSTAGDPMHEIWSRIK